MSGIARVANGMDEADELFSCLRLLAKPIR
jgi:hypothetical protein